MRKDLGNLEVTDVTFNLPDTNSRVASCLYAIEIGFRELIIQELAKAAGPRWFKQRVPEVVRREAMARYQEERTSTWTRMVPLHPIYYTNFGELRQIMDRADNWRLFSHFFESREVLLGTLSELDPIRNKIAHNRLATSADLTIAIAALEKLSNSVGLRSFAALVDHCTSAPSISSLIQKCLDSLVEISLRVKEYADAELGPLEQFSNACWFDDDYLGRNLDPVRRVIQLVKDYGSIPRGRGLGHLKEAWSSRVQPRIAFEAARICLKEILDETAV